MEYGKAKYIEGLLNSKKIKTVSAFEFTKLVNKEQYRPHIEEKWEIHTYKKTLGKYHRNYLDAIGVLNNVEWYADATGGEKMKVVIYTPTWHEYGEIVI